MINRARVLWSALVFALGTSSAVADEHGFYFGAGGGSVTAKDKEDVIVGPFNIGKVDLNQDETGYKAFVGYNFLSWLAVEAGYTVLGHPSVDETIPFAPPVNDTQVELELDLTAWQGFLVGTIPLGPVDIFGKIGWAALSSDSELKTNSPNGAPPLSTKTNSVNDESMAVYGVGAAFNFGHWAIRAEYEAYDADNLDDLYFISGSLIYHLY